MLVYRSASQPIATLAHLEALIDQLSAAADHPLHDRLRDALVDLVHVNVREVLGEKWGASLAAVDRVLDVHEGEEAVAPDARVFPHEWIATPTRYVKVDAVEHHDDHFFPGPTDVAWDGAATVVEFDLDRPRAEFFLERYLRESGDVRIRERLRAFVVAYLAFRAGYSTLASTTLGTSDDGVRFSRAARRYARRRKRSLADWPRLVPAG